MKTIIYIHGFASSGNSSKGTMIRKAFPDCKVVTPTLDSDPKKAVKALIDLVAAEITDAGTADNVVLVGSSLGGMMARYFSLTLNIDAVLINPLVDATEMNQFLGSNCNFKTKEVFKFTEENVKYLGELEETINTVTDIIKRNDRGYAAEITTLLATDDETLDYTKALGLPNVIETTGGHRMDNEEFLTLVKNYI